MYAIQTILHLNTSQVLLVMQYLMEQIGKKVKIIVLLTYLSNFWGSLEMPLINCRVEGSLGWIVKIAYYLVAKI